ncbi:MAG: eight-cysteine-cluster domain-containing protein [Candidatus Aenigmatarchaeota archaeon]
MTYDKKLTGIIVFTWFIVAILIMNFSQNVSFRQIDSKPVMPSKNLHKSNHVNEASITIHVIAGDGFCGSSTQETCSADADCVAGGCSGQVCQSKNEESIISTCEWKECYDNEKYGLSCQCVEGKCQWN